MSGVTFVWSDLPLLSVPIGFLAAMVLLGWDIVTWPRSGAPWLATWAGIAVPLWVYLVVQYLWMPWVDAITVWLMVQVLVICAWLVAAGLVVSLCVGRTVRPGADRVFRPHLLGLLAGLGISALGWKGAEHVDAMLGGLGVLTTLWSAVSGGTGDGRFQQGRRASGALMAAIAGIVGLSHLLFAQQPTGPFDTLGWTRAAGALLMVGAVVSLERRLPLGVLGATTVAGALLLGAQRYDVEKIPRMAERIGVPVVQENALAFRSATCATSAVGAPPTGRCSNVPSPPLALPAGTPLNQVDPDAELLVGQGWCAPNAHAPTDHHVTFADGWFFDGDGPMDQAALQLRLAHLPEYTSFDVQASAPIDLQTYVDLCTRQGIHFCRIAP